MKEQIRHIVGVVAMIWVIMAVSAKAAEIKKADNLDMLSEGTSWVGGIVPGTNDTAVWDGEVAVSGEWTYGLGTNTAWHGLLITNSVSIFTITNDGSTLTLGAGGIEFSEATNNAFNCTIYSPLHLSANQSWTAVTRPLYLWGPVSGVGELTLRGAACAFYAPIDLPAGLNVACWVMHLRENAWVTGPIMVSPWSNLWLNKAIDTDWSETFVGNSLTNNGIFDFGAESIGTAHVTVTLQEGDQLVTTPTDSRNSGRVNVVNNNVIQDGGYLAANWFYVNSGCMTQRQGKTFVDYAMHVGFGSPYELTNRCLNVSGGTLDVRRLHIGTAASQGYPGAVEITGGSVWATRANAPEFTGVELAAVRADLESGFSAAPSGFLTVSGGTLRTMQIVFGSILHSRPSAWDVTNGYARFHLKGGEVTVGAAGIGPSEVWNRTTNMAPDTAQSWYDVSLSGGTLGAYSSYTNWARTRLSDIDGGVTIRAADTNGIGYKIIMTQPLLGRGSLRKTGSGTLALAAANTYTGATVVAEGTLEMVATSQWAEISGVALPEAFGVWNTDNLSGNAGALVTSWASTNGTWAFNSTVAKAISASFTSPVIGTERINGYRTVSFNGTYNALAMTGNGPTTPASGVSNLTVAVVMRSDSPGIGSTTGDWRWNTGIIGQTFNNNWWGIGYSKDSRAGAGVGGQGDGTLAAWGAPRNLNEGEPHVLIYVWQNASNVVMNLDGYRTVSYDVSKTQTTARVKTRIILGSNENRLCFKGEIAEIRFYQTAFTQEQQRSLGLELAQKYGVETAGYLTEAQLAIGSLVSKEVRIESGATFQTAEVGTRVQPGQVFRGGGSVSGTLIVGTNGVIQTTADESLTVNALTFESDSVYRWEQAVEGMPQAITVDELTLPQGTVTVDIDAAGENPAPHGVLMRYTGTLTDNGVTWRLLGGRGSTRVTHDTTNKLLYLSTLTGTIIVVQ